MVDGSLQHIWLYQDQLRPVAQLSPTGSVEQLYLYASYPHVPDVILTPSASYRVLTDPNGSVRRIVNTADGSVVQAIDYDVFGKVLQDTNPGFQPFGYAGGHYDQDTQLTRFGARDYDPVIGRWTAKDPLLFEGGDLDLYNYAFADPINFIDITGAIPQWMNDFDRWSNDTGFLDFTVGLGNSASFGIGGILNNLINGETAVDGCSAAYSAGTLLGVLLQAIIGGMANPARGAAAGGGASGGGRPSGSPKPDRWFRLGPHDRTGGVSASFGKNVRVDFGRLPGVGKRASRLPQFARGRRFLHYHRRGRGPGQGIGRHRPWESNSHDSSWWRRF